MNEQPVAETTNTVSGGIQTGPVLLGRDIQVEIHLPAPAPLALAQLPPPVASFTGREAELAAIGRFLAPAPPAATVVISAVAGLAGVGKTALVVTAGHAAVRNGWYPSGVLFIDLHGYDEVPVEPAQALDTFLRALAVPSEHIPHGSDARAALYRSVLAQIDEPVLIMADNCSSEAQVAPLLPGLGPHRAVVTSRHTLAGLDARLLDVTVLDDEAALRLLDTALRVARPDDDRISADGAGALRIAKACGGLPLALRIVAALMRVDPARTTSDMAADLDAEEGRLERLRYADGSDADTRSVAAAFELSVRRLDGVSARLFELLPLSPGPDIAAAAAAALAGLTTGQTRDALFALARAHLLESAAGVGGRWRMHDLVRLYAQQQCDQQVVASDRDAARDRVLIFYTENARAADEHLSALPGTTLPKAFTDRTDALRWLDAEQHVLVSAVAMAARTGRDQITIELPIRLAQYLSLRWRQDDKIAVSTLSLATARRLGRQLDEAAALISLGNALTSKHRFDEAAVALHDAAAIYRETENPDREAAALNNLGLALHGARRFEAALAMHQQAAAIFGEIEDQRHMGNALDNLGLVLRDMRRFDEAVAVHRDTVLIFQQTGDRRSEGIALTNLGTALREVVDLEEAVTTHRRAVAIFRETADIYREATALNNLALTLRGMGDVDEAVATLQQAASIFHKTGDRHGEGSTQNNLGTLFQDMRKYADALAAHQEALAIYRKIGSGHAEGRALNNLGDALRELQRLDEAVIAHRRAAEIFADTGDSHSEAIALRNVELDYDAQ